VPRGPESLGGRRGVLFIYSRYEIADTEIPAVDVLQCAWRKPRSEYRTFWGLRLVM